MTFAEQNTKILIKQSFWIICVLLKMALVPHWVICGTFIYICVHRIQMCIALEFILRVAWGRTRSCFFPLMNKRFVMRHLWDSVSVAHMPFDATLGAWIASTRMQHVPKLSTLSRLICFVLLSQCFSSEAFAPSLAQWESKSTFLLFTNALHCPQPSMALV